MRELTSSELHAVSGGAVAVEVGAVAAEAERVIMAHRLPEQAHFDYAPPPMKVMPRP